jgi:adenosylcobinamide-phosphate synthase
MGPDAPWWVLSAALALDLGLGDPDGWPHPVRWMGRAIAGFEPRFRRLSVAVPFQGALFAGVLILSAGLAAAGLVAAAAWWHPFAGTAVSVILLYWSLSARGLADAALAVHAPLMEGRLTAARRALAMIVGREVATLGCGGVSRAAVETVAENLVDGVLAPMMFFALGGAPLAIAYKMVNTLDSMVGYKNERYQDFGRAAARIDDAANYLPARFSVPMVALAAHFLIGRGRQTWTSGMADGRRHTSPNAGYPEAAFAGALQVRLGGASRYHGCWVRKPVIGERFAPARAEHIPRACELMLLTTLLAAGAVTLLQWI